MNNISLIIFDLDGTLVDAYKAIYRSVDFTLRRLGYPRQDERVIHKAVGWGDKNLLKTFIKEEDIDKALLIYRRHHAQSLLSWSRLFPGVRGFLAALKKRGYRLAIASNRPRKFSLILLRYCAIRDFFSIVLCGDQVKKGKPDPEILRVIMERMGIPPRRSLYVGDMFIDIQTAKRAGIRAVGVTTGSSTPEELRREKPEAMVSDIRDLLELLPAEAAQ